MDRNEAIKLCEARVDLLKKVLKMRIMAIKENLDLVSEELDNPELMGDFSAASISIIEDRSNDIQYDVQKAHGEVKELRLRISNLHAEICKGRKRV